MAPVELTHAQSSSALGNWNCGNWKVFAHFPPVATMFGLFLSLLAHIYKSGWTGENERTFIAVKPDGVQRKLVGEIVRRFEKKGFKLVALKLVMASEELLREHYWHLRKRPFYDRLVRDMSSGPIVAMVWQGLDVIKTGRIMLGETSPAESRPGTIRGDTGLEVRRNAIHGSDSVESAQREMSLWFCESELSSWNICSSDWIYS